ncbi:MAG TPA: VOC family protein [Bacteroidota bacterium]|nr:VOC family protein [Bacteroidota bacterium]
MTLPATTSIGHVHLQIADLDQALAFYETLLGFRLHRREQNRAQLSATGFAPAQIILSELPGARPKPARTTGLFHVAIRLPNRKELARLLKRLAEHRYPFTGFSDHGVSEALYLNDPFGLGIELYCDRPREEWPMENGKLRMYTQPLDVEGLLAEVESESSEWNGIAPGTDIGHVHLHVSDLGKAEEFYCRRMGFEVTERGYPGALFVSAGGYHHHLGLNIWAGRGAPPPPSDAVGLLAYSIVIPDTSALQILAGVFETANAIVDKTDRRIVVRDQDGMIVELVHQP